MPDWRNAPEYAFTQTLKREQWAWEFLRRNPEYREDYHWFITTWNALETEYGKPPHRDFTRWKQDPRAWRSTQEILDCEPGHACASEGENALIECWMGQKWGFYKFPIDPGKDRPVPGEELLWRVPETEHRVLDENEIRHYLKHEEQVALGFDLTLPLAEQVDHARRLLAILQRQLRKSSPEKIRNVPNLAGRWQIQLRILDALASSAPREQIVDAFSAEGIEIHEALFDETVQMMRNNYRSLLFIPEK